MELTNKAAYLKGLADGMKLSEKNDDTSKMLMAIIDMLDEVSESVEDLYDLNDEMTELVDTIDHDLGELENDYYEIDEECDCDDCDDSECECTGCDDYDEEYEYEVTCPTCNNEMVLDEATVAQGQINCPNCNELLEFDFDDQDSEEECGCCKK